MRKMQATWWLVGERFRLLWFLFSVIGTNLCFSICHAQESLTAPSHVCNPKESILDNVELKVAEENWRKWVHRVAGTTPFVSINKNSEWKFSESQLSALYLNPTEFPLAPGSKIGGDVVDTISVPSLQMAQGLNERDQAIVNRSLEAIRNRNEDELIVIFMGEIHATDLYMQTGSRYDTVFVSYPKDSQTSEESEGLIKLFAELGSSERRKKVDEDSAVSQLGIAARLYYYNKALGKRIAWDEFEAGTEAASPGVIVIQDYHAIHVDPDFSVVPDSETLKALGFDHVSVFMEGFPTGEVTDESLETKYDFGKTYQKARPEQAKTIRASSPSAWQIMISGDAIQYPELKDLHERLKAMREQGIKIKLLGLE